MVSTSLTTVRTSIADAAKVVYVDKTEAVEDIPLRENMLWVGILERVEGLLGGFTMQRACFEYIWLLEL